jgi:hypothetical protein
MVALWDAILRYIIKELRKTMFAKIKKTNLGAAAVISLLIPVLGTKVHAQNERGGQYNGCVNANFNGSYGWLQFVNNCDESLHMTWFWRDRDYSGSSSDDVGVGRAALTGESRSEVQRHRGYELYVCRAGYLPVDSSGRIITNGGSNPQDYRCKPQ